MPSITGDGFDLPVSKRQRIIQPQFSAQEKKESQSRIFSHFRTLGLVSPTTVPFTSVRLGKSTYQITTSVGRVLQTYDLKRGLSLVFASQPRTPGLITATFAWKNYVFAAWGGLRPGEESGIWVYQRGKKIAELENAPNTTGSVSRILVFGSWIIGCCERSIQVWKNLSFEHYTTLLPEVSRGASDLPVFTGQVCNMPTYLNKIFVGRYDGTVELWNVSSGKLLHRFAPSTAKDDAVTAIEATPVLSLIAIAYRSGTVVLRNVESDEVLMSLNASTSKSHSITSISFRTDGMGAGEDGRKAGVMATASMYSGDVTLWDLNNGGKKTGVLRSAHDMTGQSSDSGVNKIEFLDGQPVLVSSGRDNALRTWIFDDSPFSPIPRPLHARGGHAAAICSLRFLPSASDGSDSIGKWLLSASRDRSFWAFSLRKDSQNVELSQGKVKATAKKRGISSAAEAAEELKAPEITSIACSLNRDPGMGASSQQVWTNSRDLKKHPQGENGWESVVTAHRGDKYARTWYWGKKKAGRWALETSDGTEVKSVAMSHCGTFAAVGSAGGIIDIYNLQSGLRRQRFPPSPSSKNKFGKVAVSGHTKAVTGLAIDNLNRNVFWDFNSGHLLADLDWAPMTAITGLRFSSINELAALSCDDLSIRVVDLETKKVVRELWGCRGQINDFVFSNDGRWIVAASMDSIIRVWDLPTGHLVDIFRVPTTCTALAFSGTGEYLATAHADEVGVHIWNNKSLFTNFRPVHIDETALISNVTSVTSTESGSGMVDAALITEEDDEDQDKTAISFEQLDRNMTTLSIVPRATWQTLINLDIVRARNKPKEPAKAPEKAPFFLPSLQDDQSSAPIAGIEDKQETAPMPITRSILSQQDSPVSKLLRPGSNNKSFSPFIDYFKSLSPGKTDLEIRSLNVQLLPDGYCELVSFVDALTERLRLKKDFELVNAWMAVFLKVHSDLICGDGDLSTAASDEDLVSALRTALMGWKKEQESEARRLSELMGYCRGIVGFLRSSR
ncbi:hypothetical protein ZTR_07200 [Talaromyces verruculosus]|nr:hypothetical protein ZTR_07200 [Talaromyces verruculosus]